MQDADRSLFTPISRDWRTRAAVYVSVLVSYVAAVQGDPLTPSMLLVFTVSCLWSLGFEHRFLRPFFPSALKIGLIVTGSIVFIAFFLAGLSRPADSFANAIARFLFWNAIVFVLSRNKTEYDVWTLGIIDVSLFMISGAFVQPPAFVPFFLAAIACVLYAFQRLALLRCGPAGEQSPHSVMLTVFQLALVLEFAALLFFLFPRNVFRARPSPRDPAGADEPLPRPDTPTGNGKTTRTGLPADPNELALESLAPLKQDRRPALKMRVRALSEDTRCTQGAPLYLRAAVYERYENGRWFANAEPRTLAADAGGWVRVPTDIRRLDEVEQHITSVPFGGNIVVALAEPTALKRASARYDRSGTFSFVEKIEQPEYVVRSNFVSERAEMDVRGLAPSRERRYLSLPPGLERLRRIANEQSARFPTPVEKVAALRHWLMREGGFTYRLGPFVAPAGTDPIEHFVTARKEGYCMHFASALALMCRAIGIPARMVGGFHAKDYDWTRHEYTVRHADAHAWVEVPFPGHGYVRFDATPDDTGPYAVPPELPPVATGDEKKKKEEEEEKKEDAERRRWDRFLVDYDPGTQAGALHALAGGIARAVGSLARFLMSPAVLAALAALTAAAVLCWLALPRDRKQRLRQILGGFRDRSSVDFYRDFLWLASKNGVRKHAALTAREFARVAAGPLPAGAVALITDKFYEVRYGGRPLAPEDGPIVKAALREIERSQNSEARSRKPE